MEIVTTVNVIAVLIVMLGRRFRMGNPLLVACWMLILFFGFRENYGNDVPMYEKTFRMINAEYVQLINEHWVGRLEIGWKLLNQFFRPFGFQTMLFFLTAVQFLTVYKLIHKYVSPRNEWIVFAFYLFSSSMMLVQLSMLRQGLSMNVVALGLPYLFDKKYVKFFLAVLLATSFHTSAWVALGLIFIPWLTKLPWKVVALTAIGMFVALFFLRLALQSVMSSMLETDEFSRYQWYASKKYGTTAEIGTGIGFMANMVVFAFVLYINKYIKPQRRFFNYSYVANYLCIPLSFLVQTISRLGMYYSFVGLPVIADMADVCRMRRRYVERAVMFMFAAQTLYDYFKFFYSDIFREHYLVYHSIFFG